MKDEQANCRDIAINTPVHISQADSKRIFLEKILFYQISYVFLFSNILIAHLDSDFSLPILAIRDSWILTLAILLIRKGDLISIFLLSAGILFGVSPVIGGYQFKPLIFLYGLRDLFLIVFVFYILANRPFRIHWLSFSIYSLFVISLAALQLAFQLFGLHEYDELLFATSEYFSSKGVESNLRGGIFGLRLTAPFYSASILGTFLIFLIFIPIISKKIKILAFPISILTVSKVVPLSLYFLLLKNRHISAVLVLTFSLATLPMLLGEFLSNSEPSILTFHAASVMDRFNSIPNMSELGGRLYPQLLGSGSVVAQVLMNGDPSSAPESIFFARINEYGYFSFFLFSPILLMYFAIGKGVRYLFIIFLAISFLSGLSNQPICYLAFAFLLRDSSKRMHPMVSFSSR